MGRRRSIQLSDDVLETPIVQAEDRRIEQYGLRTVAGRLQHEVGAPLAKHGCGLIVQVALFALGSQVDRKRSANDTLAASIAVCCGRRYATTATSAEAAAPVLPGGRQLCGSSIASSLFFSVGSRSNTSLR